MLFKYFIFLLSYDLVFSKIFSATLEDGNVVVKKGFPTNWIARSAFVDRVSKDGWAYLEVETKEKYPDTLQSYSAGFVEGYLTRDLIYNSWRNMQEGFCKWKGEVYCKNLMDFLQKNYQWMKQNIQTQRNTNPIWHQVELILSQLKGLSDGYNKYSPATKQITLNDFLLMNLSGDLEDLDNVISPTKQNITLKQWVDSKEHFGDGHCSALIKVLPNNADLLVSHVTWNSFQSMLRIWKKYTLRVKKTGNSSELIPGYLSTFSSYPTYLGSGDDYSLISSGLLTMETTIGNSNPELWHFVKPEGEIPEWIRSIVANRLATSGEEWSKIFRQYNSGTYNNQWMIVDYKLFKPGKPIKPKTLFVLEQIPGHVRYGDQSEILKSQTYWPSYNSPFYKDIYNLSGLPSLVEKYGDWFSYDKTPRALIFKRDHHKVKDMDSFFKLMRYNDFKNDPLSRCNCTPPYSAENGISARNDLNPKTGSYPFVALGHRSHGGTDCKATNSNFFAKLSFMAVSGPTYDQQPVFRWSKQDFAKDTPHYGHPDAWEFPILEHKWFL